MEEGEEKAVSAATDCHENSGKLAAILTDSHDLPNPALRDNALYEVLDIGHDTTAKEIRNAYVLMTRKYYPSTTADHDTINAKFKRISEAYQVLSEPDKRKRYHLAGKKGSKDPNGIEPQRLFALIFSGPNFDNLVNELSATIGLNRNSPEFQLVVDSFADLKRQALDVDIATGERSQTALYIAANEGRQGAIKELLGAGVDANKCNEFGKSALMVASRAADVTSEARLACMRCLVKSGADVNAVDEDGKQAIHFIASIGDTRCLEFLLKHGANPSAVTKGKTPMHLCALNNHSEIAEVLIKYGAKLNARDPISMTPLMYASLKHSNEVLSVHMKEGADLMQQSECGSTALHVAAMGSDAISEETVRFLCQAGSPLNIKKEQGICPLHLYADFERAKCVEKLLASGCDPNLQCESGFTTLIRVCNARNRIKDKIALVRILLRAGADVNMKNDNGNSVMSYLADTDELEIIEMVLDAGADINVRDKQGDTPLHEAAMGNHPLTVELLVRRGAAVDVRNKEDKETPLFIAAKKGFTEVVKVLIAAKATITIRDKNGITPYNAALAAGHDSAASLLNR